MRSWAGDEAGVPSFGGGSQAGGNMPSFGGGSGSAGSGGSVLIQYGISLAVLAAAGLFALLYRRKPRRR